MVTLYFLLGFLTLCWRFVSNNNILILLEHNWKIHAFELQPSHPIETDFCQVVSGNIEEEVITWLSHTSDNWIDQVNRAKWGTENTQS